MRLFYALALACGLSTVLLAQERPFCNVTVPSSIRTFEQQCSQNIRGGVITGDVLVTLRNNQVLEIPGFIGQGDEQQQLFLGDVVFTFNTAANNNAGIIRFARDLEIDPSAVDFNVVANSPQGNARIRVPFFGGFETYNRQRFDEFVSLIRGAAVAAPIELVNWSATAQQQGVSLAWSSAMEYNNAYYGIEHSTDGTTFAEVTRVAGQEISIEQLDYTYLHPTPAAGTNYYRLTQTDLDGTRTVFNVLTVTVDGTAATTLFPNPASAGTSIRLGTAPTTVETTLHHLDGRLITRYPAGLQRLSLPGDLATGLYLVRSGERISRLLVR